MGDPIDKLATDIPTPESATKTKELTDFIDEVFETDDSIDLARAGLGEAMEAEAATHKAIKQPKVRASVMKPVGGAGTSVIMRHLTKMRTPLMAAVLFVLFNLPITDKLFKSAGIDNPITILLIKSAIFILVIAIVQYL